MARRLRYQNTVRNRFVNFWPNSQWNSNCEENRNSEISILCANKVTKPIGLPSFQANVNRASNVDACFSESLQPLRSSLILMRRTSLRKTLYIIHSDLRPPSVIDVETRHPDCWDVVGQCKKTSLGSPFWDNPQNSNGK